MTSKRQIIGPWLVSTLFLLIFTIGCSTGDPADTTTVNIDLGLNNKGEIRSITGKDAALAGVTGISLTVSGSDMGTLTKDIPLATGKLSLKVPSGKARLFRVTAYTPTGNLGGSTTANLVEGTPADLTIAMAYQYTGVTVNLSFPGGTPGSSSLTYTLNVKNSGVTSSYPYTSGSPVQVGSGEEREIEVLAETPSVTFRWAVTGEELVPGGSVSYSAGVTLYETKIIVQDYTFSKIVQIDNMLGDNNTPKNAVNLNLSGGIGIGIFSPYDIDYDSQGRIYIVNYNSSTDSAVIRIDDINDTVPEIAGGTGVSNMVAVAVDRANKRLYYANATTLYQNDLANSAETTPTITGISNITGLESDQNGRLYITCYYNTSNAVVLYDPSIPGVVASYSVATGTPWDALYRPPYLYVTNFLGGNNNLILRLDTGLTAAAGYGTQVTGGINDTSEGAFYGPRKFLAIRNDALIIIDDGADYTSSYDKLISMSDITGSINWQVYGNSASFGAGEFDFYGIC